MIQAQSAAVKRSIYRGQWERIPDVSVLEPESRDRVDDFKFDDINPKHHFVVVYKATLPIQRDRKVSFRLTSDDGSKLIVDGKNVIDNDGIHAASTKSGSIKLSKGSHEILLVYWQAGGEVELKLEIEDPVIGWIDAAS